jgi:hypothetical protein
MDKAGYGIEDDEVKEQLSQGARDLVNFISK